MSKPSTKPRWATGGPGGSPDITVPASGAQDKGHVAGTALTAGLANWFWNLTGQWIDYIDTELPRDVRAYEGFWRARNAWLQTARTDWSYTATSSATPFYALAASPSGSGAAGFKYYAVGGTNPGTATIRVSKDGQNWVSGTPGSSYANSFRCAIYFNSQIVIAGMGGEIQTSFSDANSWTRRKTGGDDILGLSAFVDATVAIAVDSGAHVWTSTNGTSWTDRGAVSGPAANYAVAAGRAGKAVLCSDNGLYASADSGVTWSLISDVAEGVTVQNRVVWSDDLRLFVASTDDGTNTTLWTSATGADGSWTQVASTTIGDPGVLWLIAVPQGVAGLIADTANDGYRMAFWDGTALTMGAFKDATSDGIYGIAYTYSQDRDESALWIVGHNGSDAALYNAVWAPILA